MNSTIKKLLNGITSASIEKYLMLTGWERLDHATNNRVVMFRNKTYSEFVLGVPSNENFVDYYERVYDIVKILSDFSEVSENSVIDSLKSAFVDRIQFRIITDFTDKGRIPLEYAAQCIEGLKELVLYSACAELDAKPVCVRANNSAKKCLSKFEFEQTQVGSFVFSIGVPVADETMEQLYFEEVSPPPDEPLEHKVVKRIETALEQIGQIVNREVRVAEFVETGFESGITANMCDALGKLQPLQSAAIKVETSIHYAEAITREVKPPVKSTLDNIHFSVVEDVSNRYKDNTIVEDVCLEGVIKMLSKGTASTEEGGEDKIRLIAQYGDQLRSIDITLSPEDHKSACDAFRDEKIVVITGTLDKSNRIWSFSEVVNFTVKE